MSDVICAAVFHLPIAFTATTPRAAEPRVAAHSRSAEMVISRPMMTAGECGEQFDCQLWLTKTKSKKCMHTHTCSLFCLCVLTHQSLTHSAHRHEPVDPRKRTTGNGLCAEQHQEGCDHELVCHWVKERAKFRGAVLRS